MPRPKTVSMRAANALLAEARTVGMVMASEATLARRLNVSRSAMRAALAHLASLGVLDRTGRGHTVRRVADDAEFFATTETESRAHLVERRFMEMTLGGELLPGTHVSESDLARRIGVSTVSVREFLIGFTRYGLIEREARGGWRLCTFDARFGQELAAFRRMLEVEAIRQFATLAPSDPAWAQIEGFRIRHAKVARAHRRDPRLFAEVDREFHRFLVSRLRNRFAESFYGVVGLVFHYHYQWDKKDEVARNAVALAEHGAILEALARRDVAGAEAALERHLASALRTLLASLTVPAGSKEHDDGAAEPDARRPQAAPARRQPARAIVGAKGLGHT